MDLDNYRTKVTNLLITPELKELSGKYVQEMLAKGYSCPRSMIRTVHQDNFVVALYHLDKLIGFLEYEIYDEDKWFWISSLYIEPDHRVKGLTELLFNELKTRMWFYPKVIGIKTNVHPHNEASLGTARKHMVEAAIEFEFIKSQDDLEADQLSLLLKFKHGEK